MSRLFLGILWLATMLLALFSTISFSNNMYRITTFVLYLIALVFTFLARRYWITYIWFAIITTLCLLY